LAFVMATAGTIGRSSFSILSIPHLLSCVVGLQAGHVETLRVAKLVHLVVQATVGRHPAFREQLQSRLIERFRDRGPGVVALDVVARAARPGRAWSAREHLDGGRGGRAWRGSRIPLPAPDEHAPVALGAAVRGEHGPVGAQRVEVEHEDAACGEAPRDRRERVLQVRRVEQVVERVVEAQHEVELAQPRQAAQVGVHQADAEAGAAARLLEHAPRYVARGRPEAAPQKRLEALARAARDVEQSSPGQSVAAGERLDVARPGLVVVPGGELVVVGSKVVVSLLNCRHGPKTRRVVKMVSFARRPAEWTLSTGIGMPPSTSAAAKPAPCSGAVPKPTTWPRRPSCAPGARATRAAKPRHARHGWRGSPGERCSGM
jgi:hypothetical protein